MPLDRFNHTIVPQPLEEAQRTSAPVLMDLAVAIINHNTRQLLQSCLEAILAQAPAEVVVVDNASGDRSAEMVAEYFPSVKLYACARNIGFGSAANIAVASCRAPYILLLNSDTLPRPGALAALLDFLVAHPRAGLVGPRLENVDGSFQRSCFPFPTPSQKFLELGSFDTVLSHVPFLRDWHPRAWTHDRVRAVPWVLGAALLLRRAAFDAVGGFDTDYFMYCEETDLCWRLKAAGWSVYYAPVATIAHVGGASTSQRNAVMTVELFRSLALFYRQHYSPLMLRCLQFVVFAAMAAKFARDRARLWIERDEARCSALRDDSVTWRLVAGDVWQWGARDG